MTGTPRTVATIQKNNFAEVRVQLVRPGGGPPLVDLRVFDLSKPQRGDPFPTKAGFCLTLDRVPALIEALHAAEREASR
ncbi:hypothetical protein AFCDBAGC_2699 [Methylobacterium cerastii]|uniref:Transcriptional coactivator p15 (PC4) C-terminal domain-containing protein n=1 Tax=Methylobacterium cerastii TaxID=932741 RepID=A0ABQ4QJ34_9HYPH|nr:hypothetical protein [Methylobacterium cerastii]GJD44830.1 hypothetical protein AFCDBAGC_2699 [Methylobacterium cerastii]